MTKKIHSNYDRLCEEWAVKFLGMDIPALMSKLPELKNEGDYLSLCHFGRKLGISLHDGCIFSPDDKKTISSNEQLNVYTLLWYAKPGSRFTNNWQPFERLKGAGPFGPAFKKGTLQPFAETFSGKMDKLIQARDALNGQILPVSDVGFELKGFDCIPMRVYFWDGDDEFPAQANLLFDSSATDFIHVESIVTIATVGVRRIVDAAGLTLGRNAF